MGDLNTDGTLDMVVANLDGNSVSVLLGNGSGGFNAAPGSPVSVNSPGRIALGDLNADGTIDMVISKLIGGSVSVLLGNGSGSFSTAAGSPVNVGTTPYGIALGDLNTDGTLDIVVAVRDDDKVSILLNQ